MRWEEFVKITGKLPVIETEVLLAGMPETGAVKVQLSRWQKAGKLIQLRRGVYLLADAFRKVNINEPYLSSVLKKPSYLSLEKALEYHNLIPEAVPVYTSVTTKRQGKFICPVGVFEYRHIKSSLFWGYTSVTLNGQTAFIASPEKALLDFFYLQRRKITMEYIQELRLQNINQVDLNKLLIYGRKFKKPKMLSVCKLIKEYIETSRKEEKTL